MHRSIQPLWRRIGRRLLLALLGLSVALLLLRDASIAGLNPAESESRLSTASVTRTLNIDSTAPASAPVIQAGLQIRNIYNLSLADQSFMAEGWYWLSWGDNVQAILNKLEIDPTTIIEFANEIEPGQYHTSELLNDEINNGTDQHHSVYVKFSGKFYINAISQRKAPFDRQHLEIAMEVKPESLSQGADRIELLPIATSTVPIAGEFTSISGFNLINTAWTRKQVVYTEPAISNETIQTESNGYSRITAVFTYAPNPWAMFLKWLLPLAVVMGIVILSPSIEGALGEARLAIPSAALLTLVVLHDGYKSNFPPAPYLTFLDELYTYSYIVCFAIFLLFLVGTNQHSRCANEAEREAVIQRVNRLDRIVQVSIMAGYLVVATIGWFWLS